MPDGRNDNSFRPMQIPLSDAAWASVKNLFPEQELRSTRSQGRPRRADRDVLNAILWIRQTGEKWHRLPATFPPVQTCYAKYCIWRKDGLIDRVIAILDKSADLETADIHLKANEH